MIDFRLFPNGQEAGITSQGCRAKAYPCRGAAEGVGKLLDHHSLAGQANVRKDIVNVNVSHCKYAHDHSKINAIVCDWQLGGHLRAKIATGRPS
eukprot:scaffold323570_cov29-Prasinocladus_malaysianus.AAC.1